MGSVTTTGGNRQALREGYGSHVANLLDMVKRNCERLMVIGDGRIAGEKPTGPLDPMDEQRILKLHEQGKALLNIARAVKRPGSYVHAYLTSRGLRPRHYVYPKGEALKRRNAEIARKKREHNLTVHELADQYGLSANRIHVILQEAA